MRIDGPAGVPSATELRRIAARTLQSTERFEHVADGLQGEAEGVCLEADGFALHGFMCAAGTVATCVISFNQSTDIAWAESCGARLGTVHDSASGCAVGHHDAAV
jgi:hypothetical protein